jgi:hypothetical protein
MRFEWAATRARSSGFGPDTSSELARKYSLGTRTVKDSSVPSLSRRIQSNWFIAACDSSLPPLPPANRAAAVQRSLHLILN